MTESRFNSAILAATLGDSNEFSVEEWRRWCFDGAAIGKEAEVRFLA
jgi:hypothetical protein